MEKLKKLITLNFYAIYGYVLFGMAAYYIPQKGAIMYLINPFISAGIIFYWFKYLIYFLIALVIELLFKFLISKMFNKNIDINIPNKTYDILFRLGILFTFIPIVFIGSFYSMMFITLFINYISTGKIRGDGYFYAYLIACIDFLVKPIFGINRRK